MKVKDGNDFENIGKLNKHGYPAVKKPKKESRSSSEVMR